MLSNLYFDVHVCYVLFALFSAWSHLTKMSIIITINSQSAASHSSFTIIIIIHSFYIALFSALEQTYCAHWHVILNE